MTVLMVGYLVAIFASVLFSSWRFAVWAIAAQSLLAGCYLFANHETLTPSSYVQILDLILIRGMIAPLVFSFAIGKGRGQSARLGPLVLLATLLLLVGSFWFASRVSQGDWHIALQWGAAISGLVIGFFILATRISLFAQLVGFLILEASIGLNELLVSKPMEWPLQIGIAITFLWTILIAAQFLKVRDQLSDLGDASMIRDEREVL